MIFFIVRLYSKLYGLVKDLFKKNLPGLGYALRRITHDRVLDIHGRKMFFSHRVSVCYGRHIAGDWNEPETHIFLNNLIEAIDGAITFVDVGANIGEFVIDITRHKNVTRVIAFEPNSDCVEAIKKSLELNEVEHYQVIEKLVGESIGQRPFAISQSVGGSSILSKESVASDSRATMTTLDLELAIDSQNTIILIDVEGYEPGVLRGAVEFIKTHQPLIIYEYNHVSKMHFKSADIKAIIGDNYTIFRLRSDASLDDDIERAWNCVAIPKNSIFSKVLRAH
jgi:FkbM family methyltransferase